MTNLLLSKDTPREPGGKLVVLFPSNPNVRLSLLVVIPIVLLYLRFLLCIV